MGAEAILHEIQTHEKRLGLALPRSYVDFLIAYYPTETTLGDVDFLHVSAVDVIDYSIIKGHFLNQSGPDQLVIDPLFGFSVLGGVDLSDLNLLKSAKVRLPEGATIELEDFGDTWSLLESFETQAELDEAYQWGDYIVSFDSKAEGPHSCLLEIPETPLPPTAKLVNFGDVQSINPARPLTLTWAPAARSLGTRSAVRRRSLRVPSRDVWTSATVSVPTGLSSSR